MDELEIGGKKYVSSKKAARDHRYHIDYIGQLIRGGKIIGKKIGRSWYVEDLSLKNYLRMEAGLDPLHDEEKNAAPERIEEEPRDTDSREFQSEARETQNTVNNSDESIDEITKQNIDISEDNEDSRYTQEENTNTEEDVEDVTVEQVHPVKKESAFAPIRIPVSVAGEKRAPVAPDTEPQMPILERRVRENADFMPINLKKPLFAATKTEVVEEKPVTIEENPINANEYASVTPEESKTEEKRARKGTIGKKIAKIAAFAIIILVISAGALLSSLVTTKIEVKDDATASARLSLP